MQDTTLTVETQVQLTSDVFCLMLRTGEALDMQPGQFVNLLVPGCYLRRPISVCDWDGERLTLVYRAVGRGTRQMTGWQAGEQVQALVGLGHGYDPDTAGDRPLLVGGGVGVPPLLYLARILRQRNVSVTAVLGYRSVEDQFLSDAFEHLGCHVRITTEDGSAGMKGYVTDALPEHATQVYACGPLPMLRALNRVLTIPGQFSLEERMGCGFGACMGCSIQTREGPKRVCREGPVFSREVLIWT